MIARPATDLREIVARLGGDLYNGGRAALVPGPGHSRKDRSLHLTVMDGRTIWHSFAGDRPDGVKAHLGLHEAEYRPLDHKAADRARRERAALEQAERRKHGRFCSIAWQGVLPLPGTPAATYLEGRGLPGVDCAALAFHPRMPRGYESKVPGPAVLACVQNAAGTPCGLHATFIKPDGSGKAGDRPKLMFGVTKAGAVRLAPMQAGKLAVAEGIETALSYAALTGIPTWAALSAGNLAAFALPPGVETLTIAADGDKAAPDWSRQHLEAEADWVAGELSAALSARLKLTLPRPIACSTHRWRYARSGVEGSGALWDADRRLGLCGDWFIGARIEAAWMSGTMLAEQIVAWDANNFR